MGTLGSFLPFLPLTPAIQLDMFDFLPSPLSLFIPLSPSFLVPQFPHPRVLLPHSEVTAEYHTITTMGACNMSATRHLHVMLNPVE